MAYTHRGTRVVRWAGTWLAVLGIGRSVQAADLTVDNADFEDVIISAGGYSYAITNWQTDNAGGGPAAWISNGYYAEESVNLVLNAGDQVDVGTLQHYRFSSLLT